MINANKNSCSKSNSPLLIPQSRLPNKRRIAPIEEKSEILPLSTRAHLSPFHLVGRFFPDFHHHGRMMLHFNDCIRYRILKISTEEVLVHEFVDSGRVGWCWLGTTHTAAELTYLLSSLDNQSSPS